MQGVVPIHVRGLPGKPAAPRVIVLLALDSAEDKGWDQAALGGGFQGYCMTNAWLVQRNDGRIDSVGVQYD